MVLVQVLLCLKQCWPNLHCESSPELLSSICKCMQLVFQFHVRLNEGLLITDCSHLVSWLDWTAAIVAQVLRLVV